MNAKLTRGIFTALGLTNAHREGFSKVLDEEEVRCMDHPIPLSRYETATYQAVRFVARAWSKEQKR